MTTDPPHNDVTDDTPTDGEVELSTMRETTSTTWRTLARANGFVLMTSPNDRDAVPADDTPTDAETEVQAMVDIVKALKHVDDAARARILRWAVDRFT